MVARRPRETGAERRGSSSADEALERRRLGKGVSFVSGHRTQRDLIAPMSSVPVGVGWRRPKAELERRTGNPYAPFGRGGPSG